MKSAIVVPRNIELGNACQQYITGYASREMLRSSLLLRTFKGKLAMQEVQWDPLHRIAAYSYCSRSLSCYLFVSLLGSH